MSSSSSTEEEAEGCQSEFFVSSRPVFPRQMLPAAERWHGVAATQDGLHLYLQSVENGPPVRYRYYHAQRESVAVSFEPFELAPNLASAEEIPITLNLLAAISPDQHQLMIVASGYGAHRLYSASRGDASQPFSSLTEFESMSSSVSAFDVHLSPTHMFIAYGTSIYRLDESSDFSVGERIVLHSEVGSPGRAEQLVLNQSETIMLIGGYLESGDNDLLWSELQATEDEWTAPVSVGELNTEEAELPVWLSNDGCEVIYLSNNQLMSASR